MLTVGLRYAYGLLYVTFMLRLCYVCSSRFVIWAGVEPATHSLEGCCSIQLSYQTVAFGTLRRKRLA